MSVASKSQSHLSFDRQNARTVLDCRIEYLVLTRLQIKRDQGPSFHGIRKEFVEEVEHEQRSRAQNPLHR